MVVSTHRVRRFDGLEALVGKACEILLFLRDVKDSIKRGGPQTLLL